MAFSVNIARVVDLLGLERNPREEGKESSFNVKCPFCRDQGYHLNINTEKNTYHCVLCMDQGQKGTGVLDLYGRIAFGTPATKGNTKELFVKLKKALGEDDTASGNQKGYQRQQKAAEKYREICPASDDVLHQVYSALLQLPYLSLADAHEKNLVSRGLKEKDIQTNGYASMPDAMKWVSNHLDTNDVTLAEAYKFCNRNETRSAIKQEWILNRYRVSDIILGVKIASDLIKQGITPANVPGFYTLAGKWAFRATDQGMLIPTRNEKGQIVSLQTRRDVKTKKGLRYMTVSSKGLKGGVTTSIARTHFPLGQSLQNSSMVILTEGPLKSDVARALAKEQGRDYFFIAIPGVNSTRELPKIARQLQRAGVKIVRDGFDADKLVNENVWKALQSVRKILKCNGEIELIPLFWDRPYAEKKAKILSEVCTQYQVDWNPTGNVFYDIQRMSTALEEKKIDFLHLKDGEEEERWNPATKGIDDYLLSLR